MTTHKKYKDDLIENFALAVKSKDFDYLTEILDRKGDFQTQDENYKLQDATRPEFLKWLKRELELTDIKKIQYKRCDGCIIGAPVVLFNFGDFGYTKDKPYHADAAGMMLEVKDGKIVLMRFCMNMKRRVMKKS
jgi:hypothetical protein